VGGVIKFLFQGKKTGGGIKGRVKGRREVRKAEG